VTAKYHVEITPMAEQDIEDIWFYIAEESPENATALILALEEQIGTLESLPERCPLIPENELLNRGYRHLIHGSYRTIFRVDGRIVYVLRVIHGVRLLELDL
jgi:plasmid stabilization system protein ParE